MTPLTITTDNLLRYALTVLAAVRILMVAGFVADRPPIQHTGWQFHCGGGDQILYFNMAKSFAALSPIKEKYPIGFPLLLTPIVLLFKPAVWQDLVLPVVIFQTLLALISIYLVGYITKALTNSTSLSILSALMWTLFPYLIYFFAGFFNTAWLRNTYVSYAMWFAMLSEPATAFFLLLNVYVYILSLKKNQWALPSGIIAGITASIRVTSFMYAAVFALGYLLNRRYRSAVVFIMAIAITLIPQFVYNFYFNEGLFVYGYTQEVERREILFSVQYARDFMVYLLSTHQVVFGICLVSALVVPISVLYTFQWQRRQWALVLTLVYVHVIVYSAWWAFTSDFIRYVLPIVPLAIISAAGLIGALQIYARTVLAHKQ
jgi:hypothetical protein